jgi:hypothetical protein
MAPCCCSGDRYGLVLQWLRLAKPGLRSETTAPRPALGNVWSSKPGYGGELNYYLTTTYFDLKK